MSIRFASLFILALASVLAISGNAGQTEAAAPLREGLIASSAPEIDTGRVIVKFRPAASAAERAAIHAGLGASVIKSIPPLSIEVVSLPNAAATRPVAAAYRRNPNVSFAEPDALAPLSDTPATIPNDTFFNIQWQHPTIDSSEAWATTTGGDYRITICDTGVALHEDLLANLETSLGYNTVYNGLGNYSPVHWHGTAVAGAAAAIGNNGKGVAGVSWTARIIPVRVTNLASGGAYFSDMVDCIVYGADKNSVAINLSYQTYSGGQISQAIIDASIYAESKGSVVVIAAGNENTNPAGAQDPATILYVAATDATDAKASFSNYGPYIDAAGPGVDIVTTYVTVTCTPGCSVSQNNLYAYVSGTSFSSPITAGAVLLVKAANPAFTPLQLRNAIRGGACDLGAPGEDIYFGTGLLNAHHAVHNEPCGPAAPDTTGPATTSIVTSPNPSNGPTLVTLTATISDGGSGNSNIAAAEYFIDTGCGAGGSGTAMVADDGAFDEPSEAVRKLNLDISSLANGNHTFYVHGKDTAPAGNWGGCGSVVLNKTVAPPPPPPPSFTLSGFGYKVKGVQHANLSWSGTDLAGNVVIQRNGVPVVTTLDDGAHVDNIGKKGGGSYQYKICESGTSNCSNIITIIF